MIMSCEKTHTELSPTSFRNKRRYGVPYSYACRPSTCCSLEVGNSCIWCKFGIFDSGFKNVSRNWKSTTQRPMPLAATALLPLRVPSIQQSVDW